MCSAVIPNNSNQLICNINHQKQMMTLLTAARSPHLPPASALHCTQCSNCSTVFNCRLNVINLNCSKTVLFYFLMQFPVFPPNPFLVVPLLFHIRFVLFDELDIFCFVQPSVFPAVVVGQDAFCLNAAAELPQCCVIIIASPSFSPRPHFFLRESSCRL